MAAVNKNAALKIKIPDLYFAKGDNIDISIIIINNSDHILSDYKINVRAPIFAKSINEPVKILSIPARGEILIRYIFKAAEGGRGLFRAELIENGTVLASDSAALDVSGPGYYSGSNHVHCFHDDDARHLNPARIITIAQMADSAYHEHFLSWVYFTPHNPYSPFPHLKEADDLRELYGEKFLVLADGLELSAGYTERTMCYFHAQIFGVTEQIGEFDKNSSRDEVRDAALDYVGIVEGETKKNTENFQKFINDINTKNALFYFNHPYRVSEKGDIDANIENLCDYSGIEVWNGRKGPTESAANASAFDLWDKLNAHGTGRYIGFAGSDAHTEPYISKPFIKAFLPALTKKNIMDALKKGNYIGTNGPEIRFNIDGAGISEVLKISGDKKTVNFNISVCDQDYGLTFVEIIRGRVSGNFILNRRIVYKHFITDGSNVFDTVIQLEVKPGDFYRVQALGEKDGFGDDRFAYTNNIWIEKHC